MDNFSFLNAAHSAYFADLYDQYIENPDSLEPSWRAFFQGYDFGTNNNFIEEIVDGVTHQIPDNVKKEFNVINHSKIKEYKYLFSEGTKNHPYSAPFITTFLDSLNIDLMKKGAKLFKGQHNFKSYCYKPNENGIFDREIIYCNQTFCDIFGIQFTPEEMLGINCKDTAKDAKHLFIDEISFIFDHQSIV